MAGPLPAAIFCCCTDEPSSSSSSNPSSSSSSKPSSSSSNPSSNPSSSSSNPSSSSSKPSSSSSNPSSAPSSVPSSSVPSTSSSQAPCRCCYGFYFNALAIAEQGYPEPGPIVGPFIGCDEGHTAPPDLECEWCFETALAIQEYIRTHHEEFGLTPSQGETVYIEVCENYVFQSTFVEPSCTCCGGTKPTSTGLFDGQTIIQVCVTTTEPAEECQCTWIWDASLGEWYPDSSSCAPVPPPLDP